MLQVVKAKLGSTVVEHVNHFMHNGGHYSILSEHIIATDDYLIGVWVITSMTFATSLANQVSE